MNGDIPLHMLSPPPQLVGQWLFGQARVFEHSNDRSRQPHTTLGLQALPVVLPRGTQG